MLGRTEDRSPNEDPAQAEARPTLRSLVYPAHVVGLERAEGRPDEEGSDMTPADIRAGRTYEGLGGFKRSVIQVFTSQHRELWPERVTYRVVQNNPGEMKSCSIRQFARWAVREVPDGE